MGSRMRLCLQPLCDSDGRNRLELGNTHGGLRQATQSICDSNKAEQIFTNVSFAPFAGRIDECTRTANRFMERRNRLYNVFK
jgi:hypothetical protein